MTRHWIVGVDGSDDSQAALRWATLTALELGDDVVPIVAWDVPATIVAEDTGPPAEADRGELRATAHRIASSCSADIGNEAGVVHAAEVIEGHPLGVLLDRAGPDRPIVVGRRGVSAVHHLLLGSISVNLVTHCQSPVVVVSTRRTPVVPRRIIVGFDGSSASEQALKWAVAIARPGATATSQPITGPLVTWLLGASPCPVAVIPDRVAG